MLPPKLHGHFFISCGDDYVPRLFQYNVYATVQQLQPGPRRPTVCGCAQTVDILQRREYSVKGGPIQHFLQQFSVNIQVNLWCI